MISPFRRTPARERSKSQILIACDDDSVAEQLQIILGSANFKSKYAKSVTTARRCIKSGRFQVVFTIPKLRDASWQQLFEFARNCDFAPSFVIMAHSFDMNDWGESLRHGAFDVLDSMTELPKAAEVARQAFATAISEASSLTSLQPDGRDLRDLPALDDCDPPLRSPQKEN